MISTNEKKKLFFSFLFSSANEQKEENEMRCENEIKKKHTKRRVYIEEVYEMSERRIVSALM
jgi:hypothetical protein